MLGDPGKENGLGGGRARSARPRRTPSRAMKLRCAGAVSGAFDVGDAVTVGELIDALARRVGVPGGDLKVFAGGRSLPADASITLDSLGVNEKTRLVVSRVRRDPAIEAQARRAAQEQARADRLAKIEQAAEALASRAGERARFELEDQDGDGLAGVSENDRKALVCGLTLHQKGRMMLDAGDFADASGFSSSPRRRSRSPTGRSPRTWTTCPSSASTPRGRSFRSSGAATPPPRGR